MQCPWCHEPETRVVDSREAEGGSTIRRRRICQGCDRRFTTFERATEVPLCIVKRDGSKEPFDRAKVMGGVTKACKNLAISDDELFAVTDDVEEALKSVGTEVPSEAVGLEVLARLKSLDEVAYLRFVSVYKGFEDVRAFEREIKALVKSRPPKTRTIKKLTDRQKNEPRK